MRCCVPAEFCLDIAKCSSRGGCSLSWGREPALPSLQVGLGGVIAISSVSPKVCSTPSSIIMAIPKCVQGAMCIINCYCVSLLSHTLVHTSWEMCGYIPGMLVCLCRPYLSPQSPLEGRLWQGLSTPAQHHVQGIEHCARYFNHQPSHALTWPAGLCRMMQV